MKLDYIEDTNENTKVEEKRPKKAARKSEPITADKKLMIEAIAGIVLLVVLIIIAIFLLVKKDKPSGDKQELAAYEAIEIDKNENSSVDAKNELENASADADESKKDDNSNAKVDLTQETKTTSVKGELPQTYTAGKALTYTKDEYQLPEIVAYWDEYKLDAVADLIRLDRVRTITDSLKGSNDFYYYGDTNSKGQPNGKGLAVYADNTYYYGDWVDGLRSGEGMWLRIFIDKTGIVNGVPGVKEHQYSGQWLADYPCGTGQEHIEYEISEINKEFTILNAMGNFKDGYYNGDMYIMTVNSSGSTIDWYGSCAMGSFTFVEDKKSTNGKRPIWKAGDGYETGEDENYRWILPKDNADFGVAGLKK